MTAKFAGVLFVLAFLGFCADGFAYEFPWAQEALDAHNAKRSACGMPPLTWDNAVADGAQEWVNGCKWEHEPQGGPGENLAAGGVPYNVKEATAGWYSEINKYNFSDPGPQQWNNAGHFIQVVWGSETRLGCGMAICPGPGPVGEGEWTFWACRYSPRSPMNIGTTEEYIKNVPNACPR